MENVIVFDHPLIQHKISILRKKSTGTNEFRALIEEIAMLMGYEALRSKNPHQIIIVFSFQCILDCDSCHDFVDS